MRQISGPVAAVVHDFTQDHIGIRIDVDVNNGIDLTIGGIAEFALGAGILPGSILGTIQFRCKALVVMCALNKDFGILHCGHFDLYTAGNMQCPRAFFKDALTGNGLLAIRPFEGDLTGEQQNCDLLALSAEFSDRAGCHAINTDIHQHVTIFVLIGRKDFLTILIKCGISEQFLFYHIELFLFPLYKTGFIENSVIIW